MTAERNIQAQLKSASKIEPDRLPRLKLIAEEWAAATADALNELYAAPVVIEFLTVSSLVFEPSAPALKIAVAATVFRSPKWREAGFVLADAKLADTLVEAMFGGNGSVATGPQRPLTKLDKRFIELAIPTMIEAANPVFQPVAPLDVTSEAMLTEGLAAALDERLPVEGRAFLELSFKIAVGQHESVLSVAMPEKALAPHRRKLTIVPAEAPLVADEGWARDITEGLQLADLEVRAILDEKQITLGDVARFMVGQTIVLDATATSPIIIECEEQRLFRGVMGRSRDAYVVRIEEKIDPTEEFIDDILSD
ncbi:MAG: FliM/FliN family flagellar motor switch protein [Rhizobiaceae bacterium]|nr:FliM/FliN family flagellar motor switch protein [Rhizobiaceae bacterium]